MKRALSSNYLLNRYSYCIYFLFCLLFLTHLKLTEWVVTTSDINFLIVATFIYLLWILVYGTFHFSDQTKVERIDYRTLNFMKGTTTTKITESDIAKIYIQKIDNHKIGHRGYKILVVGKNSKKYRFTYISRLSSFPNLDLIDSFLGETENFWGVGNKDMILLSPSFLFCN